MRAKKINEEFTLKGPSEEELEALAMNYEEVAKVIEKLIPTFDDLDYTEKEILESSIEIFEAQARKTWDLINEE